jgi:chromosome segregation ATPase
MSNVDEARDLFAPYRKPVGMHDNGEEHLVMRYAAKCDQLQTELDALRIIVDNEFSCARRNTQLQEQLENLSFENAQLRNANIRLQKNFDDIQKMHRTLLQDKMVLRTARDEAFRELREARKQLEKANEECYRRGAIADDAIRVLDKALDESDGLRKELKDRAWEVDHYVELHSKFKGLYEDLLKNMQVQRDEVDWLLSPPAISASARPIVYTERRHGERRSGARRKGGSLERRGA